MTDLKQAYEIALKTFIDMDKYNEYKEILVRSDSEGKPIHYWLWRGNCSGRTAECRAFKHNSGANIAIGNTYGDIGKGYFEYLEEIIVFPRKIPIRKTPEGFRKISEGYKGKDKEIINIYEQKIKPNLIKMMPNVQELEMETFKFIVEEYGLKYDYFGPRSDTYFTCYKKLNFKSLDEVVRELEEIPKLVTRYDFITKLF